MRTLSCVICFLLLAISSHAQKTRVMAFPITDYIIDSDSAMIVQIKLPQGMTIKDKGYGLIRSVYSQADDSVMRIGDGRCYLVKGEYYYFGLVKKNLARKPIAGDLLYADVQVPDIYQGLLFDVIIYGITLNSVDEKLLADLETISKFRTAEDEKKVMNLLVDDIRYTGTEMPKMAPGQDQVISSGRFKDKKLFAAMQNISEDDVVAFLKYIRARPEKYAGNTWKISEIMATWMVAGAPTATN